jgi:hypothetical protein
VTNGQCGSGRTRGLEQVIAMYESMKADNPLNFEARRLFLRAFGNLKVLGGSGELITP